MPGSAELASEDRSVPIVKYLLQGDQVEWADFLGNPTGSVFGLRPFVLGTHRFGQELDVVSDDAKCRGCRGTFGRE